MIHTDGIQTIANAPVRTAEPAVRLAPSKRSISLTDEHWEALRLLLSHAEEAIGPLLLTHSETRALRALDAELNNA